MLDVHRGPFFVLQALQFARTGAYLRTMAEFSGLLEGDEALVLEVGRRCCGLVSCVIVALATTCPTQYTSETQK